MAGKFGALSSSVDPQKLSTSVEGAMRAVAGILVAFGLIAAPDGNMLIDQVGLFVAAAYAAWNSGELIFGLLRKILVKFAG